MQLLSTLFNVYKYNTSLQIAVPDVMEPVMAGAPDRPARLTLMV